MNNFYRSLYCAVIFFLLTFQLSAEPEDGRLEEILKKTDPQELLTSLREILPELSAENLKTGLLRLAATEEMLGQIDDARRHYLQAAFADTEGRDIPGMLRSAALLIEQGDMDEAETICKAAINTTKNQNTLEEATVLLSRIHYLRGLPDSSWQILESTVLPVSPSLSPASLYWVYTLARLIGKTDIQAEIEGILESHHSKSPEFLLFEGKAAEFPSPMEFFGLLQREEKETPLEMTKLADDTPSDTDMMIQTGSFLDRENAEFHVKDLADAGFTAEIKSKSMSGKVYHRVLITDVPASEVQNYLIRLKDKGYEGWPLYE